jgi:hypothetical protein
VKKKKEQNGRDILRIIKNEVSKEVFKIYTALEKIQIRIIKLERIIAKLKRKFIFTKKRKKEDKKYG